MCRSYITGRGFKNNDSEYENLGNVKTVPCKHKRYTRKCTHDSLPATVESMTLDKHKLRIFMFWGFPKLAGRWPKACRTTEVVVLLQMLPDVTQLYPELVRE